MHSRISIRGCVCPSISTSVGRSVRPSVRPSATNVKWVEIMIKCLFWATMSETTSWSTSMHEKASIVQTLFDLFFFYKIPVYKIASLDFLEKFRKNYEQDQAGFCVTVIKLFFRCVLASKEEDVSIRRLVGSSVRWSIHRPQMSWNHEKRLFRAK